MNQALTVPEAEQGLVEEFDLGSARGGAKKAGPLEVEIIRQLTPSDLPAILNPPAVTAQAPVIKSIRHSHHRLAQLLAEGKGGAEISLLTGYSQSYLSTIQGDPAFEELVHYYSTQRESIFVDAQERLKALGIDAVEKLHERLHDPAVPWSNRELMEVGKMALPTETSSKIQPIQGGGGPATLNVLEIKFVGARPIGAGQVIEGGFTEVALPGSGK